MDVDQINTFPDEPFYDEIKEKMDNFLLNLNIPDFDESFLMSVEANVKEALKKDKQFIHRVFCQLETERESECFLTDKKKYMINVLKLLEPDNEIATTLVYYLVKSTVVKHLPHSMCQILLRFMNKWKSILIQWNQEPKNSFLTRSNEFTESFQNFI